VFPALRSVVPHLVAKPALMQRAWAQERILVFVAALADNQVCLISCSRPCQARPGGGGGMMGPFRLGAHASKRLVLFQSMGMGLAGFRTIPAGSWWT
jgi:hypothetical protein